MLWVKGLTVGYGESMILKGINLEVPPGKVVCLMGRNGVGKTTLLKSIMGLLKPHAGRILFNEKDVTDHAPHRRARAGIGYVPQGRGIFPYLTVYENLLMGLEAGKSEGALALQEMFELFPILMNISSKLAGTLSGGQQQQLAIARALVGRPELLLLDEPTEGIQPSIVLQIEDVIQSIKEQSATSVLLVEQFVDFALGVADYYYIMEKGFIVSEGATRELKQEVVTEYLAV